MTQVTIVCGPPGAGKSHYVQEHLHWGDLVLDIDTLFMALSGQVSYDKPATLLKMVLRVRDTVVAELMGPNNIARAWLITSTTKHDEILGMAGKLAGRWIPAFAGMTEGGHAGPPVHIVVLEVPANICMQRVQADPRRADKLAEWQPLIEKWWANWRTLPGAERVTG
jgi:hypothetical protein